MSWLADFRRDVGRYRRQEGGGALRQLLLEQGLWALLQYRAHHAVHRSRLARPIKAPLHLGLTLARKFIEVATGISLPCAAEIGAGLYLPHFGLRIVNAGVIIGIDCCITQGVTIGVTGNEKHRGTPFIGDRVFIGANAVVVGGIRVGDDAVIGANSLVNRDVPPRAIALGVPAVVVKERAPVDCLETAPGYG